MRARIERSRLATAVTTTLAVAAIVLGSLIGLDEWADSAATQVASSDTAS